MFKVFICRNSNGENYLQKVIELFYKKEVLLWSLTIYLYLLLFCSPKMNLNYLPILNFLIFL